MGQHQGWPISHINDERVTAPDLATLRRWERGGVKGVTRETAEGYLYRYHLSPEGFESWGHMTGEQVILRGSSIYIEQENTHG